MQELLRLRRFLDAPAVSPASGGRCEFCGVAIREPHSHVVDLEQRRLVCSCRPCYLLFQNPGAAGGRFRSVGERCESIGEAGLGLDGFEMPIGMAFFIRSSKSNQVAAFYPSPGGAMESGLQVDVPLPIEADIEALLVYRRKGKAATWIVPVDLCYELVGRIRRCWRGFDGGTEVYAEIEAFFTKLKEQRSATCPI
jgi:uncharacterized protein DUF5947